MSITRVLLISCLLASLALLAACNRAGDSELFGAPAANGGSNNAIEFRGQRACVDCQSIDAWLRLEQRGDEQRYRLVEDYRSEGRERRFEDAGQWQSSGDLLRLRSADGGERVYAVLADNRLQAVDSRGRPLAAAADDVMVPISYSNDH